MHAGTIHSYSTDTVPSEAFLDGTTGLQTSYRRAGPAEGFRVATSVRAQRRTVVGMMQSNKSMQWKAAAFVLAQILVMNHAVLDSVLARVWDACKTSSLFKHDTWEPGLVVISWFTFTIFWCATCNHLKQICFQRSIGHRRGFRMQQFSMMLCISDCESLPIIESPLSKSSRCYFAASRVDQWQGFSLQRISHVSEMYTGTHSTTTFHRPNSTEYSN